MARAGRHPTMEQLRALEAELRKYPQADIPVKHHFADGIYCREVFIPAGTVLTGKVHRFATLNILAQGEIEVTTPEGVRRLCAPAVFTSPAGCKKVGYAHTDTIWINVHPTKLRDVASIESKFIEPEPLPAITHEGE
ncbi:hypothetical protein ACP93_02645 [Xanthomonas sp. NCPPB 1128]|nr:hypothetical protein ACP93_02380 [Xanthomonas sp. NCPPB 1128]KMM77261.1 hypothetical protein ACP93_02645 [Xanthomonas sp. NCPPB 1128]